MTQFIHPLKWVVFLRTYDKGWISGYLNTSDNSIGYTGKVTAHNKGFLAEYYDTQRILQPPPLTEDNTPHPEFLITANALIWKPALEMITGFIKRFIRYGKGNKITARPHNLDLKPTTFKPQKPSTINQILATTQQSHQSLYITQIKQNYT